MSETKTYVVDDRRRAAALKAVDGLPTEWLERGFVNAMYRACAIFLCCDRWGERDGKYIRHFEDWWNTHVLSELEALNNIAKPDRIT